MATNNIKPFATDSGANVLTDTALASRSELQTGFPLKSKADSALIGKLMQNATAGAYAVGEFSAKYGTTDISGSDPTGFATAFETALESYIGEKAPTPDLSDYVQKQSSDTSGTMSYNASVDIGGLVSGFLYSYTHTFNDISYKTYFGIGAAPTSSSSGWSGFYVNDGTNSYVYDNNGTYQAGSIIFDLTNQRFGKIPSTAQSIEDLDAIVFNKDLVSYLNNYASLTGANFTGAITVQAPTENSNPATKQYVDNAISNVSIDTSNLVEKESIGLGPTSIKCSIESPVLSGSGSINISPLSTTLRNKTDNSAIGTEEIESISTVLYLGALYNVQSYGKGWSASRGLSITSDKTTSAHLEEHLEKELYYPNNAVIFDLDNENFGYVNNNFNFKNFAYRDEIPDVSTKINVSGNRGNLAGYEDTTVSSSALTINQESPDSQQLTAAVAITVSDGSAGTAWVKKVSIKNASVTISLGSAWTWVGGSQPTVTAPSLLVLSWDNDCGMAILNTTG